MLRIPAVPVLKTLTPRTPWAATTPRYSETSLPSMLGVVVMIIVVSLLPGAGCAVPSRDAVVDVLADPTHHLLLRASPSRTVTVSAISCAKLAGASKGAAWAAPSSRWILAVGMAAARDCVRRAMKSGLREP